MIVTHRIDETQFDALLNRLESHVRKVLTEYGITPQPQTVGDVIAGLPRKKCTCSAGQNGYHYEDCELYENR